MNSSTRLAAGPLVLASLASLALLAAAPAAHANSAASASLSFSALGGSGFNWLTTPVSTADSSAASTPFTGFELVAGVFGPTYGAAVMTDDLGLGTAVPASSANASVGDVFSSAFSFGNPVTATLQASALVPTEGQASATSFARSWFSLDAGASVTFQGALLMALTGSNPAFPANYNTSDFYSFASGLLAVGTEETVRELGGPATTGMVGSYSLNDFGMLSLTVTNSTANLLTTYLDSGVTVYSASVVPEPGIYALLLAGLGVIGFMARRRSVL